MGSQTKTRAAQQLRGFSFSKTLTPSSLRDLYLVPLTLILALNHVHFKYPVDRRKTLTSLLCSMPQVIHVNIETNSDFSLGTTRRVRMVPLHPYTFYLLKGIPVYLFILPRLLYPIFLLENILLLEGHIFYRLAGENVAALNCSFVFRINTCSERGFAINASNSV